MTRPLHSACPRLPAAWRQLLACCAVLLGAPSAAAVEIVVPAYFYPSGSGNSHWTAMTNAADDVEITAIMNPGNGPGNARDNNYVNVVNAFRAAGGRVIGYVYSSYGARPLAEVTADVDKFAQWYDVDGIFVDEMWNNGPAEKLNYYKSIYDHVKSINPDWEVMGNPGTTTIEQYLTWPAADRLMVFENVGAQYPGHTPSAWNANYDRSRFVHLVHTEASSANMEMYLQLALARNVGGIYVTNDVLNNPWDTLPTYWQAEVDAVAELTNVFPSADFNEDGSVGGEDLERWRDGFGRAHPRVWRGDGDEDGDNDVDGEDFLQWQRGLTPAEAIVAAAPVHAVAEPTANCLGVAAAVLATAAGRTSLRGLRPRDTMIRRPLPQPQSARFPQTLD